MLLFQPKSATARFRLAACSAALFLSASHSAHADGPPDIVWSQGVNAHVGAVGWMPGDQKYFTAGHTLRIHNRDGSIHRTYPVYGQRAAPSPDGQYMAVAGVDFLKLVRLSDGVTVWTKALTNHAMHREVSFSPSGNSIACGTRAHGGALYRASDGAQLAGLSTSWAFANAGNLIATRGGAGIQIIHTVDGSLDHEIPVGGDPRAFNPNDTRLVVSVAHSTTGIRHARIHEVSSGQLLHTFDAKTFHFRYSANGDQLYTWDWTTRADIYHHAYLDVFDMATFVGTRLVTTPETLGYFCMGLSEDASRFVVGGYVTEPGVGPYREYAEVYDTATGERLPNTEGHGNHVSAVAFSGDLRMVASASNDGHIHLRSRADGSLLNSIHFHFPVSRMRFSPDSSLLAVASGGGGVLRVYRTSDLSVYMTVEYSLAQGAVYVTDAAFSPDGKKLAVAHHHPHFKLDFYDVATKALTATWSNGQGYNAVAYSADGKYLAYIRNGGVAVHNAATNAQIWAHSNAGLCLAISPNGKYIATGGDGMVRLHNLATGAVIKEMTEATGRVHDLAFSADGNTLLTGSRDAKLRFWNAATGALLKTYTQETGGPEAINDGVTGVAFPCDGFDFAYVTGAASVTMARNPYYKTPTIRTLGLTPASVGGGGSSVGKVALTWCAPPGGVTVQLSKAAPLTAASLPGSLFIGEAMMTSTFGITTTPVTETQTGNITAALGGSVKNAAFSIKPPGLSSVTVAPTSVIGGVGATGTVTLTGAPAAGTGGVVVNLSSSSGAAGVPATVTVPEGSTSATFSITTVGVSTSTIATITASYDGVNKTGKLTVKPPALLSVKLLPTKVKGGTQNSVGTVALTGIAPAGGFTVTLTSNHAAGQVPASVVVPEGEKTAAVTVTTSAVAVTTYVTITAKNGTIVKTAKLTVTP